MSVKSQRGATLIEMMLACSLSIFLLTGLMQIYLACKQNMDLQQSQANMQESGHFAVVFLNQAIRMAGYANCGGSTQPVNQDLAIQGFSSALPPYLQGKVVSDTDSIVIGLCQTENGKTQFVQKAFFISPTTRKNSVGQTITALYEMPINSDKAELVPDVTHMQIQYGISAKSSITSIDRYVPAAQVGDWHQVRAVQISLLVQSEKPRLRLASQHWFTYIALRERP
ncbi:MAG: PilW family protein [Gammaproteobacteria bacterium]